METAVSWENAAYSPSGLPQRIADVFEASELKRAKLLLAVAEHKVPLEGKGGDSQCDVWALVDSKAGIASVAVEAKAKEPFGANNESLAKWLQGGSSSGSKPNRAKRWEHVKANLPKPSAGTYDAVPFQILQRAAAAIIEARRFRLSRAVFLVQSFEAPQDSFEKYALFANALGLPAKPGALAFSDSGDIRLGIGWVECLFASDADMATALTGEKGPTSTPNHRLLRTSLTRRRCAVPLADERQS
jgi:hypothetical protein